MILPFISRKKLLKEINKICDDINYNIEVWNKSNNSNKQYYVYGLNSEMIALYQIQYYLRNDKHWKTLKFVKELEKICSHGYEDWDKCPNCCH